MISPVHLERCILRAETLDDYKRFVVRNNHTDGEQLPLLHKLITQNAEVHLGQVIPACDGCPVNLSVVDLIPATAGVLCETTTVVVLPPPLARETVVEENVQPTGQRDYDEVDSDMCRVILDYSLTGNMTIGSREFFLRTLLLDGALVSLGDDEYTTVFTVSEEEEGERQQQQQQQHYLADVNGVVPPTLRTSPEVFRNIRASLLLDPLPSVVSDEIRYSDSYLNIPLSFFIGIQDDKGTPLTINSTNFDVELELSCAIFVPAWPSFMLTALFGDKYEQLLTLALRASKDILHGRIVGEGDIVILRVTPRSFVEQQLVCTDACEVMLAHVTHIVQGGYAETTKISLLHDGVIAIPLRVSEVRSSSGKSYGVLALNGNGTELLLSLRSSLSFADVTPLFSPFSPLKTFHPQLSLTVGIRNAMDYCYSPSHSSETRIFVIHATKENLPYECIATALGANGIEALIVDLERRSDEEMLELISDYMHSRGEVALIVKNAQELTEHLQILHLFDSNDNKYDDYFCTRVIFLVCESIEAPPPTIAARACNVEGVIKGTNPSDADRFLILSNIFAEAQRLFGLCKSLLLSFDSVASWTVGLSVSDVVAYIQECVSAVRMMPLAEGVYPVLSENVCGSILEKYQKAHGYNLVSTKLQPVRWSDVGGLEDAKRELRETIQLPLLHPELFSSGTKRRTGILFYGPPGCGKTLLAKAVATEMGMNFMSVKGPELINQYVGESERNIRLLFQRARDHSPCILFFDELDALVPARGAAGDAGGAMDRVAAQLLVEMDGAVRGRSDGTAAAAVFVVGATNRPDLLDPALLRPGRFDTLCYLGIPATRHEQRQAITALTRKFNLAKDVDFDTLLDTLSLEYTGADLFALCSDAMMFAVETMLQDAMKDAEITKTTTNTVEENNSNEGPQLVVRMADFLRARSQLKPSVSKEDLKRYESLRTKFNMR
ncbi:peroxisome assembly protein [Trypanosoma theileri]|uniref:Peroxisomal ATPase PEX6 n=1 Tax=Trypanosoma theileri TaxID=67003 RepID=A0A1X0NZ72_9TRYP|nr:peroxisome assembly protein [Trypanosoma theileri]ORC89975.1 peroxisome assembly protein [Trypanosoma theileri]